MLTIRLFFTPKILHVGSELFEWFWCNCGPVLWDTLYACKAAELRVTSDLSSVRHVPRIAQIQCRSSLWTSDCVVDHALRLMSNASYIANFVASSGLASSRDDLHALLWRRHLWDRTSRQCYFSCAFMPPPPKAFCFWMSVSLSVCLTN